MRKQFRNAVLLLCLLSFCKITAQDFKNDYQPLKSVNPIPKDFLQLSSEKFEADKQTISKEEKARIAKNKTEFLLSSNFSNDYLLASGKILFNDPVTVYCNKVMDVLLKDNPTLRSKVRCYAAKSTSVNAFTTQNGIIYITTGLIAQLETEAQLAFILSHEIVHFENNHNINAYVENREIERGKGVYRNQSFDQKIISKSKFSKEHETEADTKGMERFLKTDYNTDNLDRVFDILQYSYLPFDDVEFKKSFFETEFYKFPESYFSEKINPIKAPEEDDETSTHPSIEKRRGLIKDKLAANAGKKTKKDFIVSKDEFTNIRAISRFELVSEHYLDNEFEPAIYVSYLLLKDYPDNYYLQKTISRSLYSISKYANNDDKSKATEKPDNIQGEQFRLYNLIDQMKSQELNVLALSYNYNLSLKHDSDADLKTINESLLKQLIMDDDFNKDMFRKEPRSAYIKAAQSLAAKDTVKKDEKMSKLDKIKSQKTEEKIALDTTETDYFKYAFVRNFKDEKFTQLYDKFVQDNEDKQKKKDAETDAQRKERVKKESAARSKRNREITKNGYSLSAQKVVVVTPNFLKADERKRQKIKYLASEASELDYTDMLIKDAALLDLKMEILSQHKLNQNDAERFNDIAFLNDWIDKRFADIDQEISITDRLRLNDLIKKYDTKYFYWGGVINLREKKYFNYVYIILMIYTWPFIPVYAYLLAKPQYETLHYAVVFDLEKGKVAMTNYRIMKKNSTNDVLQSNIYDTLHQIKKSPKKK
ncbi:MAG: M48 family metallopeptidase [Bacteroidia bacterium]